MLLIFSEPVPDSLEVGIARIVNNVYNTLRSLQIPEKNWDGDLISIDTQFPKWIQDLYAVDTANAPVIEFFKYYYRWLMDYEDGYGCGFYLENLRNILLVESAFLQAYADDVFGSELDFAEYPELVDSFRTFYLCHARDYFYIRGTPDGIVYILKSLFKCSTASVTTLSPANLKIVSDLASSYEDLVKSLACPYGFNVIFEAA